MAPKPKKKKEKPLDKDVYDRPVAKEVRDMVERAYTDVRGGGFMGLESFVRAFRKKHPEISSHDIRATVKSLKGYALHKDMKEMRKKRMGMRKFILPGPFQTVFGDLLFLKEYEWHNRRKYIALIVVDGFSKYTWVEVLKNKTAPVTAEALEKILDSIAPEEVKTFISDKGGEFLGETSKLLESRNIKQILTDSKFKASIAERKIRFLKEIVHRVITQTGDKAWIDYIQDVVYAMNHMHSRQLGMAPAEVNYSNSHLVFKRLYAKYFEDVERYKEMASQPLPLGTAVRLAVKKKTFRKGYKQRWMDEPHYVIKVNDKSVPVTYRIENGKGEVLNKLYTRSELNVIV